MGEWEKIGDKFGKFPLNEVSLTQIWKFPIEKVTRILGRLKI